LVAVVCLMLAVPPTRAHSQPDTASANYVMPGCRAFLARGERDQLMQGLCVGRTDGVCDTAVVLGRVCSPPQVTAGQAIGVVVQFIEARPVRMHEPFTKLALEALIAAWPCK
jgi:hypothetical protein